MGSHGEHNTGDTDTSILSQVIIITVIRVM